MIYSIFQDKVRQFPEHLAFVLEDGRKLSYAQASILVDNFANYLSLLGVKQGQRVGVLLDFESLHPFLFYALDKLNASYVPFDLVIPKEQLEEDVKRLGITLVIRDKGGRTEHSPYPPLHTFIDMPEILERQPSFVINRDDSIPTYLVASSGTSGNKKWMGINGAGLGYWEKTEEIQLGLKRGHKVLCTRSPGYDARISEYLRALIAGGELHLISRDQRRDLDFMIRYCKENKITEILLIASQLKLDDIESIIQNLAEGGLKNLIVTGDACHPNLQALCEQYKINLVNAYGPTEACFGVSLQIVNDLKLSDEQGHPVVPIGLPFGEEIKIHLLDEKVYIQSPYLIDGYIDNPEATSKMFKIIEIDGHPTRVFDTGDRADLIEGKLRFKGRLESSDDCKINGVKVDKQDIENQLIRVASAEPGFVNAVVVSKEVEGLTRLVAYLVVKPGFDSKSLNDQLVKKLLPEQVPALIALSELPILFVSQKIDKQALIRRKDKLEEYLLYQSESASIEQYSDPTVLLLRSYWKELLGFDPPTNQSDFTQIGGKSIDLTRMISKIRAGLNETITMLDVLKLGHVTIESLYQLITSNRKLEQGPMTAIINLLSGTFDPKKKNFYILPHLLGDGFFSYKYLAENILSNRHDINIWGLTDPGIHDETLIDKSDEQMIAQYVEAIIQNERDTLKKEKIDVCLAGYSYGCFLAYRVALGLCMKGHNLKELHLIDGFPPHYFHKQSRVQHAELLQNFYQFISTILNGESQGENIDLNKFPVIHELDKLSQVQRVFQCLISQSKNASSHRMLLIAKQHLIHMLNYREKKTLDVPLTRLYFSHPDQVFFKVLSELPDSQYQGQTMKFGYWDKYLKKITQCSSVSEYTHLDLINQKKGSNTFFAYGRYKKESNLAGESFALRPIVFVEKNETGFYNITACHLSLKETNLINKLLSSEGFFNNNRSKLREFEYSIKSTISKNNNDVTYVMKSAIMINTAKKSLADDIILNIRFVCFDGVSLIEKTPLMKNTWDVICQEKPEKFCLKVNFFNEFNKPVEMAYLCQGKKELLQQALLRAHLPANAKIENSNQTLTLSFYCFSDEARLSGMKRVNELLKKITPIVLPYVIAGHEKVLPMVDEFFGLKSEAEFPPLILLKV